MSSAEKTTKPRKSVDGFRLNRYASPTMVTKDLTTTEAIGAWHRWANAGGLIAHTSKQYLSLVTEFFVVTGKEFYDVSPEDLVNWAEALNTRGPTMAYCGHKALSNFWKWLRANGLDDRAITEHMPYSQPRTKIPEAFTPGELSQILLKARSIRSRWGPDCVHIFFTFLYRTGARRQEALNINLEDLSSEGVILRETKRSSQGSGSERFIPFGADGAALDELMSQGIKRRPQDLVFPFRTSTTSYWAKQLTQITGIHVHPHKFRATFATRLLTQGVDIRTVQELLGHRDVKTTMRYLAVTDERKLAAVELLV